MSSDISFNSGMHNEAEVPDEQPTSATQENGPDLENLREPQDHSAASFRPSINEQLSSPIDSLGITDRGGEPLESAAHSSKSSFEKLPPEMKEEIAKHLSRKDLSRLSQANKALYRQFDKATFGKLPPEMKEEVAANLPRKDLHSLSLASKALYNQFNKAAHDSMIRSKEIEDGAGEINRMTRRRLDTSSEFAAQMTKLSLQRPADQGRDLNTFLNSGPNILPPHQAAQLWSQLLKHPIDPQNVHSMNLAVSSKLPANESSGIVNGLLDQIERQSIEGTLPTENEIRGLDHPLEIAARMVRHMSSQEQQAAANRIRAIAQSQNRPLEKINHYLNGF